MLPSIVPIRLTCRERVCFRLASEQRIVLVLPICDAAVVAAAVVVAVAVAVGVVVDDVVVAAADVPDCS